LKQSVPLVETRRVYVLDTNVLMHDPAAIFRFEEHDIYLPMVVLEELDHHKKGLSEPARNVRQVSRFLDDLMRGATKADIDAGIRIESALNGNGKGLSSGRLFFQTRTLEGRLPEGLPGHEPDNSILSQTLALQNELAGTRVTLVSKDINLRIKAAIVGVHAEDYTSDRTIEDVDLLDVGSHARGRRSPAGTATSSCTRPPTRASRPWSAALPATRRAWSWCATTAANAMRSGASPRATASRTSR